MASWGYETLLGAADFAAATLAGWGNIGTTLTILATERGTERFLQVLDQGGTMEQAFWSGVTTGALDRILNKLPVEKLLGKSSGKVRQTLWKTMKEQGLLQMGSEAAGRVTDIVADTVVMGEQSEYKRLEAQYLKQGLNGKEARRQALLDLAGSVAVSGGSGLVQGAALGTVGELARRLFQMGNSGAEIEQEQPVQYIDPEQGSLDDNVRNLYAYYREQAQGASAQAGQTAVSAGQAVQAGDGSSQPVDATGAARAMLERAFPQDEQTSVQGQMADGQGVAQNTAAPVVNGQPVYSDIALADYMAKRAAQQKFGDATRSGAEAQQTGVTEAEVQPELEHTTTAIPEENVVASSDIDGTIGTEENIITKPFTFKLTRKIKEALKTEKDNAYFWSGLGKGGDKIAMQIAGDNNGTTLEHQIAVHKIEMPEWSFQDKNSQRAWQQVSNYYAQKCSGNVHVIVGDKVRANSVFISTELVALKNNPNVDSIIIINLSTGDSTVIFDRLNSENNAQLVEYIGDDGQKFIKFERK